MTLKEQVDKEIKEAMKARDQTTLQALRGIKSQILLAETAGGAEGDLSKEMENKLLTKAAKQRKESLDIYIKQNRQDLAEVEQRELAIIEKFLPKQLSEEETKSKLVEIINKSGATGIQDLGKVMGIATKELSGMADGKLISSLVKEILSGIKG